MDSRMTRQSEPPARMQHYPQNTPLSRSPRNNPDYQNERYNQDPPQNPPVPYGPGHNAHNIQSGNSSHNYNYNSHNGQGR